ncbi:SdrD B-like domain-containing protein [Microbacterium sp. 22195]|uniref:SdrD B-like domain-containing protein n=1 Tax=Microbacterium sp. 22195 TaxID=3453891 RepID=UPI003F869177
MKKLTAGAVALATVAAMTVAVAPAAMADAGDGTITLTVVEDVNASSARDAVDTPLNGVTVRIADAAGHTVTRTTNASGQVVVAAGDAGNTLVGGKYRIAVTNPNTGLYSEAHVVDGHAEPQFAPATSFVDVSGGKVATVSVGYLELAALGAANATIFSAVQPDSIWPGATENKEIYSVPYRLNKAPVAVTPRVTTGSVYGIGIDQKAQKLYAGAYAKRGSAYGPGGPGAIYRVDPFTGTTDVYATVADAGTTTHDMTETNLAGHALQDYSFRTAVGRESLGDVEVTPDSKFLLAVNMHTDSVVVYPVQATTNPVPVQTLAVAPVNCAADQDWAPMGIGLNDGKVYIGATCGATSQASVIEYAISAQGILTPTGVVLSGDPKTAPGHSVVPSGNIPTAAECQKVDWMPWRDDVPQPCIDNSAAVSPPDPAGQGLARQFSVPQPMLSDLEFTETGGLILGFRDRGGDQYSSMLYYGQRTAGQPAYSNYIATGDIVGVCIDGSTLNFDCRGNQLRGGDFDDYGGLHNEAAFGGMVAVPGTNRIVINEMDATELWSNGLRAFDPATGNKAAGSTGTADRLVTNDFQKAQGLADMEALVLNASQQIGNRIWLDSDGDGIQDPGEPIAAGVQVSLYDEAGVLVAKTETDANGEYWFDSGDGLKPATKYQVRLDRPADFAAGGPLAGTTPTGTAVGGDRGIDSNGRTADVSGTPTVVADITTPAANINDHSIDFGFVPSPVSIGDYVWIDADNDGQQDAGETPVAGVTVTLRDRNGVVVATTTTDADGYYAFKDLQASSDYTVVFPTTVTVDGRKYMLTQPGRGNSKTDSNAAVDTGNATVRTPVLGSNLTAPGKADDPTIDAGYVSLVSVGDYVWIDADADGIQDAGEKPVPGATVKLLTPEGEVVATTTTDTNGYYVFPDLRPSTDYVIEFPTSVVVDGTTVALTKPGAGEDGTVDSNPAVATGRAPVTTPAAGENSTEPGQADDPTIDAGYIVPPVSIGDYVWIDVDRDGQQDAGEKPVPGATVRLLSPEGDVLATTKTDEDGYYAFTDLAPGTEYVVEFPKSVTVDGVSHVLTTPAQGDAATDSNPAVDTGRATVTTPLNGSNSGEPGKADVPTIDAGYVPTLVSVGDYVWIDADSDGIQDAGERPVPGATVRLLTPEGDVVTTTTTDANGYYVFTDLPNSTDYIIEFPTTVMVDGTQLPLTSPGAGTDGKVDSNPAVATGRAPVTTPATGQNSAEPGQADDPTIDAGYIVPPVSIGDYVWIDVDRDGQQDAGEKPVPGATVRLLSPEGDVLATTKTDEDGYYAFTDLAPGTEYVVEFPKSVTVDGVSHVLTTPAQGDAATDSNPAVDTGRATVTTPLNGSNSGEPGKAGVPTIDAGYVPTLVSVGDYVWVDADGDGIQDDGEKPVPGAEVKLLTPDGDVVATTTTDANGYYVFPNLPNSTDYVIEFPTTVTIGDDLYRLTTPGAGGDDAADSNAEVATGRAPVTTPANGSNSTEPGEADDPTIDAGFVLQPKPILVSVGDYVWFDKDHDGVQDPGEKPIGGVTVKLFDENGALVATTKTDENGYYAFTDLKPSTEYTIEFPKSVTVDGSTVPLTSANRGGDDARDSDANPSTGRITFVTTASGTNSAEPGKADLPTLDAGYAPVELATTGGALPWTLGSIAALLLMIGAGLMLVRRRRTASMEEQTGTAGSLLQ